MDAQAWCFSLERYSSIKDEIAPLAAAHYAEVAAERTGGQAVALSDSYYESMERQGMHRCYTARIADELIGYCSMIIHDDIHSDGHLRASEDAIFVKPERRGWIGSEFEAWIDRQLGGTGATMVYRERPIKSLDQLDRILRRGPLGYKPMAVVWCKPLLKREG